MARLLSRQSTAKFNLPMYIGFLLSEPKYISCVRIGNAMNVSHDSVNRFMHRVDYTPKDLFDESTKDINLNGGTVSVDDMVIDKPYANYISYIGYFYSGKHHRVVQGINLITLYYTDKSNVSMPINFRIYDKADNKSKNDYFLEMMDEVMSWGLKPEYVTGDSWYSSVENLKAIKNNGLSFQFAIESNRIVSVEKGTRDNVSNIDIPKEGKVVWLKDYGHIKVFRSNLRNQVRHYILSIADNEVSKDDHTQLDQINEDKFEELHDTHWKIEQYHRTVKQVCNIERFYIRGASGVRTHLFASICGFVALQRMTVNDLIANCYEISRELFKTVIADFVKNFAPTMKNLLPKYNKVYNA